MKNHINDEKAVHSKTNHLPIKSKSYTVWHNDQSSCQSQKVVKQNPMLPDTSITNAKNKTLFANTWLAWY